MILEKSLIQKYNRPVPRYTSYPTVPFWKEGIDGKDWEEHLYPAFDRANSGEGISLYIHLPFCETNCTYCGCNKRVTSDHRVEEDYLKALQSEWEMYLSVSHKRPLIREIHLGGGTPTFFSPENLEKLIHIIFAHSRKHREFTMSVEGHPNNTTVRHLEVLYRLGARRLSLGVQDNDEKVQRLINRFQPFENVIRVTEAARNMGYLSVNYDLIYGLPGQTPESIRRTVSEVIGQRPDRIAFYSYAHVPWTSKSQRLFDENDLPSPEMKIRLYAEASQMFIKAGYNDIGMDHFSLPTDELYLAMESGNLHRNFMGYTVNPSPFLIGLGSSAISDTGTAMVQNDKNLLSYYEKVNSKKWAVNKGYFTNETDRHFRRYILDITCNKKTIIQPEDRALFKTQSRPHLEELVSDGLVIIDGDYVVVTSRGKPFIRNICKAFDLHLIQTEGFSDKQFSRAI